MTTLYQEGYKEGVRVTQSTAQYDLDVAYSEGYTAGTRCSMWACCACTAIGGLVSAICILYLRLI